MKEERKVSSATTPVDYRKGDLKHQIVNVVKPALQDYRFQSFKEFKALLGLFNVCLLYTSIPAYLTNTKVMSVTFFPSTGSCPPPRFMTG